MALPGPALAQATGDQARLIFTVSAGAAAAKDLWSVGAQPVQFVTPADTLALGRRIRSTLVVGFGGSYFPGENLGLAVEGFRIGLGFEDSCRLAFSSGSGDVATACQSIQGATKAATAVILSAGPVFRVNSRKLVSPYARGNIGISFSTQSSLRTIGQYPTSEGTATLVVYDDESDSRIAPAFALGAGFTAAVAKGYQLRWEVRDNIVGVQTVTGPTPQPQVVPPHKLVFKHLFSMTIGFSVVLERRRGRRY
jgi:opacity protein-like surface antigen